MGDINEERGLFRALRLEWELPSEREAGAAPVRPRYMSRRLRDDVRLSVVPTCQRAADGRRLGICAWGDDQARKHNRQEDERSPHDLSFLYPQLPALGWGARWRNRAVAARAPRPSFVQYLESTFLRTERARRYPFPRPARRLTCKTSENRGRILPKQATTAKKCDRCGGSFVPRVGPGRPRRFCRFCTPRSDEDKAAAREHWARVADERRHRQSEELREFHPRWRERIRTS